MTYSAKARECVFNPKTACARELILGNPNLFKCSKPMLSLLSDAIGQLENPDGRALALETFAHVFSACPDSKKSIMGELNESFVNSLFFAMHSRDPSIKLMGYEAMNLIVREYKSLPGGKAREIGEVLFSELPMFHERGPALDLVAMQIARRIMDLDAQTIPNQHERLFWSLASDNPLVLEAAVEFASSCLLNGVRFEPKCIGDMRKLAAHEYLPVAEGARAFLELHAELIAD